MDFFVKAIILEEAENPQEREDKARIIEAFNSKVLLARKPTNDFVTDWLHMRKVAYASYVSQRFPYTYKPQGFVFEALENQPTWAMPLNSWHIKDLFEHLTGEPKKIPPANAFHTLLDNFLFYTVLKMENATDAENSVRRFKELTGKEVFEEDMYTEVLFNGTIKIWPRALFGFSEDNLETLKSFLNTPGKRIVDNALKFKTALDAIRDLQQRRLDR